MVDTQHFCLRWNNYQSSITSAFENLRDDEDFVDVTLACDGKSLKAHRVVLSACSPYFRELLKSTPCKHPVIVLQDVAWTDLHALVEFIYHGEVNVHQRSLSSFLKTAEVLRVSGLTQKHADDRDQLAQVQGLVRAQQQQQQQQQQHQHQQQPPVTNHHHHPAFPDRLLEDSLFTSPSSPPHGATVNQLLRRAAMQHSRRERRISQDPVTTNTPAADHPLDHKRSRNNNTDHNLPHINNNNNELNLSSHLHLPNHPPQTQPTDFSPTAMKNNNLTPIMLNNIRSSDNMNNGISSTDNGGGSSPSSPSPTIHSRDGETVKSEPMDLLCGTNQQGDNSNDSTNMNDTMNDNGPNQLPPGPHSGSSGEHDDQDSPIGPYLTPTESKLFASAAGSFNFSMAALAADPTGLGGLNQSLQGNADTLAGTSQGASPKKVFTCQLCGKVLCSKASLKRHIADKHAERQEEYRCVICERVYCSRNSLMTHIYTYHKSRPGDIDIKFF